MNDTDVVVIGGGPAGATTAFHLSRLGHRVTVLERDRSERVKPCAGGMAASVQQWFPFDLQPAVDDVIQQVDFSWCLTDPVVAELPGSAPFWIVKRERLDALLLEQAIALGAELRRPFEVEDLQQDESHWLLRSKDGEVIEARAVVLADGSGSPWPTRLGIGPRSLHMAKTLSVPVSYTHLRAHET